MLLAEVILPLATPVCYTYRIPPSITTDGEDHNDGVLPQAGMRVLVPLRKKKIYTGVILSLQETNPTINEDYAALKDIIEIIDNEPTVCHEQLRLWQWIADYYLCTIGEVMKAALPAPMKPESETRLSLNMDFEATEQLPQKQQRILDALLDGKPHSIDQIVRQIGIKTLLPTIQELLSLGAISTEEQVKLKYEGQKYKGQLTEQRALQPLHTLSPAQTTALQGIRQSFSLHNVTLLFGVTASGKTDIYTHLIQEQLSLGKQVLFLVPEIALTTQLTDRLRSIFGNQMCVYHSRLTDRERTNIYMHELHTSKLIVGVRSSLFLPFRNLGLIIVDEEHETSYKQQDPAPRYHARDTAIVLASFYNAKVLLGTATPAIETFYNANIGKYGLVQLKERYKNLSLPTIRMIDLQQQYHKKEMYGHFSDPLFLKTKEEVQKGKQVILFQNRRGYSPYLECKQCAYVPKCINCDVALTVHNGSKTSDSNSRLVCHYCGYTIIKPDTCPACKSKDSLTDMGFGTEKIEDELHELLPDAKVARLDLDTTRQKDSHHRIIKDFADHKIDILVGTQMVTKGLHFNDVSVVGVMRADNLLNQPDFRATEQTYHKLEQVAGRAGRTHEEGEVYIQTSDPNHPVFSWLQEHNYTAMYNAQLHERQLFRYPPFYRLISITIKARELSRLETAALTLQETLRKIFGMRCSNVITPAISRIQNMHNRQLLLKIERESNIRKAKELLANAIHYTTSLPQCKGTIIFCDVDPL